jgi:hypothetical protein
MSGDGGSSFRTGNGELITGAKDTGGWIGGSGCWGVVGAAFGVSVLCPGFPGLPAETP